MLTSILLALILNFQSVAPKPDLNFTTTQGTSYLTIDTRSSYIEPNLTIQLGVKGYKGEIKFTTSDASQVCHLNDIKKILGYVKDQLPPEPVKQEGNLLNLSNYAIGSTAVYTYDPCLLSTTVECKIIRIQTVLKEAEKEKAIQDEAIKKQNEMRDLLNKCSFIMEKQ